jgi:acyl carrier protein
MSTLLAAEPTERLGLLQSYLSGQVARVLGLSTAKVDVRQPLTNLGLDSLMAVELKNAIAVDLGVNVPMVRFLSGPTIEQAAADLLQLLASGSGSSSPLASAVPHQESEQGDSGIAELSDEEVNSMLTDMLAKEEVGE